MQTIAANKVYLFPFIILFDLYLSWILYIYINLFQFNLHNISFFQQNWYIKLKGIGDSKCVQLNNCFPFGPSNKVFAKVTYEDGVAELTGYIDSTCETKLPIPFGNIPNY